jgi:hypothetical protein
MGCYSLPFNTICCWENRKGIAFQIKFYVDVPKCWRTDSDYKLRRIFLTSLSKSLVKANSVQSYHVYLGYGGFWMAVYILWPGSTSSSELTYNNKTLGHPIVLLNGEWTHRKTSTVGVQRRQRSQRDSNLLPQSEHARPRFETCHNTRKWVSVMDDERPKTMGYRIPSR